MWPDFKGIETTRTLPGTSLPIITMWPDFKGIETQVLGILTTAT